MERFAARLGLLRAAHGWTLAEVARRLNLTESTISRYEAGTRFPDIRTLIRIGELFGVSLDYLVGRSDRGALERVSLREHLAHFPSDVQRFIVDEEKAGYILVAKDVADAELDPDSVRLLVQLIRSEIARRKDNGRGRAPHAHDAEDKTRGHQGPGVAEDNNPNQGRRENAKHGGQREAR